MFTLESTVQYSETGSVGVGVGDGDVLLCVCVEILFEEQQAHCTLLRDLELDETHWSSG